MVVSRLVVWSESEEGCREGRRVEERNSGGDDGLL